MKTLKKGSNNIVHGLEALRKNAFLKLLIAVLLLLSAMNIFPREVHAAARSTITTSDIQSVLDYYGYIDGGKDDGSGGTYWTYNKTTGDKNSYMAGTQPGTASGWTGYKYEVSDWWQCAGFALHMGYALSGFKEDPLTSDKWIRYTTYDGAAADTGGFQVGDIVALKYNGNQHMAMVYKVNGNKYTFAQANNANCYFKINTPFWIKGACSTLADFKAKDIGAPYSNGIRVYRYTGNVVLPDPMQRFERLGSDSNGYYRIARDDGQLKEWPYSDATTKETKAVNVAYSSLNADDILYVEQKVKNTRGSIWAQVKTSRNDKRFHYFDNLELLYKQIDSIKRFATPRMGSFRYKFPFGSAKVIGINTSVDNLTLTGKFQDAAGNTWYQIADDGGYMPEMMLLGIAAPKPTVTFTGSYAGATSGYPTGNLTQGNGFGLRGTVSCDEGLQTVTGRIIDHATGTDALNSLSPITVTTSAKSYTVNQYAGGKCINNLNFDNLAKGSYRYQIDVVTASGYSTTVFSSSFTVGGGAAPSSVPVESIDIYYFGEFVLEGSNNPCLESFNENRIGFTGLISAAVYPAEATNQTLTWTSSNPSVATVKANESFTVRGVGQTTITAAATDGSGVSSSFVLNVTCNHSATQWIITKDATPEETGIETDTCTICGQTFENRVIPKKVQLVETIQVGEFNHHLEIGQSYQLDVSVYPANATNPGLEFYSSDPSVATVSETGVITALKHGYTDILIRPQDGGTSFWGEMITVNQAPVDLINGYSSVDLQYLVVADMNHQVSTKIRVDQSGYYTMHITGSQIAATGLHNLDNDQDSFGVVHSSTASCPDVPMNDLNGIYYLTAGEEYTVFITFDDSSEDSLAHLTVTPCELCDDSYKDIDRFPVYEGHYSALIPGGTDSTLHPGEEWHILLDMIVEGDYNLYTKNPNAEDDSEIYLYDAYGQLVAYDDNSYRGLEARIDFHAPVSHTYLAVIRNKGLSDATFSVCLNKEKPEKTVQVGDNVFARLSFEKCVLFGSGDTWNTINLDFWNSAYISGNYIGDLTVEEGVTSIGDNMFNGVYLNSISLPNGLQRIGSYAFNDDGFLTRLDLPSSVTEIGAYAFANNYRLSEFTMPVALNKISDGLFMNCYALASISIPESVTEIGAHAFEDCDSLHRSKLTLPYGLTKIGDSAFKNVQEVYITPLPETLTTIGDYAFAGSRVACHSPWFTIPASVTSIGDHAFEDATLYYLRVYQGSAAHQYVLANNMDFTVIDLVEPTGIRVFAMDLLPDQYADFDDYIHVLPDGAYANVLFEETENDIIEVSRNGKVYALFPGISTVHAYNAGNPDMGNDTKVYVHGEMQVSACVKEVRSDGFTMLISGEGWATDTISRFELWFGNEYLTIDGDIEIISAGGENCIAYRTTDYKKADGWSNDYARYVIYSPDGDFHINDLMISVPLRDTRGIDMLMDTEQTYPINAVISKSGVGANVGVETQRSIEIIYSIMTNPDMMLPASLTHIEEEAFAFVQAKSIKLGEYVESIGIRAFADSSLRQIYIPAACTSIATDAFANITDLVIYGKVGSYAETYASAHGFVFRTVE